MDNKGIVAEVFEGWVDGSRHIAEIFAPDMTWEISGRSPVAGRYPDAASFGREALEPFGRRFRVDAPCKPVAVRGIYAENDTIVVVWDARGTTLIDTEYSNTYVWIMRMQDGLVVDGMSVYDGIPFTELWDIEPR